MIRRALAVACCSAVLIPLGGQSPSTAGAAPQAAAMPAGATASSSQIDDPYLRAELGRFALSRSGEASRTVSVEVLHGGDDRAATAAIAQAGGTVTGEAPGSLVQARIPVASIGALQSAPGVDYVRLPVPVDIRPTESSYATSGLLLGEAVGITNANVWHAAGLRGSGVRIGIIDYFNQAKWTTQTRDDEVPALAGTFCLDSGSPCSVWDSRETGHGNAVAEVIHDVAPDATVYLGQAGTISDLYALIDWFAANGVTIINRSLGAAYDGPGDGTGPLNDLANYAVAKGITWFNSAGNEGSQQYWRGRWQDPDNDGWLDFSPGDESLQVTGAGSCLSLLGARWNDWGPPETRTNYDFFIYADNTQVWPDGPPPDQRLGAPPLELNGVEGCEFGQLSIRIQKRSSGGDTSDDVLELLTYNGDLEYSQSANSAGGPIVDSANRGVIAVGAIDPAYGGMIGYYSSRGPTNDGRRKPDLSAPSCFTSSIFRSFNACFNGTSAASPVAAATAALLRSAGLAASPQGLAALVKHSAVDRGEPGPDSVYGTGEIRLPPPPAGAVPAEPAAFTSITPSRLVDTRRGLGPLARRLEPEEIVDVQVAGSSLVPAGATSVALNVTVVDAGGGGYAQVFPTGWAPVDGSSSINLDRRGQTLANFVVSPIGAGGQISLYSVTGGHLLIDVLGYFVPTGDRAVAAGRLVPLAPVRVLDTRQSAATSPGLVPTAWRDHQPGAKELVTVEFRPTAGLPAVGAGAVVLTVTATASPTDGYVTAYPAGSPPDASTLNLIAGSTNANTTIVPIGPDGKIRLFTSSGAHLIADLVGYITNDSAASDTAGRFVPLRPFRALDTRGLRAPMTSGIGRSFLLGGAGGIPPAGAAAVSLNATVTGTAGAGGYVALSPTGESRSGEFSSVNWTASGDTVATGTVAKLGTGGNVDARSYQSTHLLLDINGYWEAAVSG